MPSNWIALPLKSPSMLSLSKDNVHANEWDLDTVAKQMHVIDSHHPWHDVSATGDRDAKGSQLWPLDEKP